VTATSPVCHVLGTKRVSGKRRLPDQRGILFFFKLENKNTHHQGRDPKSAVYRGPWAGRRAEGPAGRQPARREAPRPAPALAPLV
jgi:hypothetical protein